MLISAKQFALSTGWRFEMALCPQIAPVRYMGIHRQMGIKMIKAGVIGWPIEQSKSPLIHGYWLDVYNIVGRYDAIAVSPDDLGEAIKRLQGQGYAGLNITVPHKEKICAIVDELTPRATRIGAVNTVVFKDNKVFGDNTDGVGFINNLKSGAEFARDSAMILGAGGAARAVLDALIQEGFRDIIIANRTTARAEALIKSFKTKTANLHVIAWEDIPNHLAELSLLVNTTSLGMAGQAELSLDLAHLSPKTLVTDIVYNPLQTALLRKATNRGNPTIDGLGMLLHQAVPGFHAWFGTEPEVTSALRTLIMADL